jgi:hypothetical protein
VLSVSLSGRTCAQPEIVASFCGSRMGTTVESVLKRESVSEQQGGGARLAEMAARGLCAAPVRVLFGFCPASFGAHTVVVQRGSAVSLLAIQHAGDFQVVAPVAEKHTVILGTEPDERRLDPPKLFRVACAVLGVARQRFEDLQGDGPLNAANVGFGLFGPDDALSDCAEVFLPAAALAPSFPNRPWSIRTPPVPPHAGSAGCA